MRGLDPAALVGLAFDAVAADEIENEVGAAGGEADQPLAPFRAEFGYDVVGIFPGEVRHDEAGIPAR